MTARLEALSRLELERVADDPCQLSARRREADRILASFGPGDEKPKEQKMTDETAAKLERLRNLPTRYELALTNLDSGDKRRLSYCARNNRSGLIAAIRSNGPELVAFCGSERFTLEGKGGSPLAMLGRWRIAFTGRTQREAISSASELRWFQASDEAAK